jgi:hypothetical protein
MLIILVVVCKMNFACNDHKGGGGKKKKRERKRLPGAKERSYWWRS